MSACEDIDEYLGSEGIDRVRAYHVTNQMNVLAHNAVRLLKDAYICLYLSDDASQHL